MSIIFMSSFLTSYCQNLTTEHSEKILHSNRLTSILSPPPCCIIEVKNSGDVSGGWWLANDVTGNFAIHENGIGDRLTIQDATGNVGIGTTSMGRS